MALGLKPGSRYVFSGSEEDIRRGLFELRLPMIAEIARVLGAARVEVWRDELTDVFEKKGMSPFVEYSSGYFRPKKDLSSLVNTALAKKPIANKIKEIAEASYVIASGESYTAVNFYDAENRLLPVIGNVFHVDSKKLAHLIAKRNRRVGTAENAVLTDAFLPTESVIPIGNGLEARLENGYYRVYRGEEELGRIGFFNLRTPTRGGIYGFITYNVPKEHEALHDGIFYMANEVANMVIEVGGTASVEKLDPWTRFAGTLMFAGHQVKGHAIAATDDIMQKFMGRISSDLRYAYEEINRRLLGGGAKVAVVAGSPNVKSDFGTKFPHVALAVGVSAHGDPSPIFDIQTLGNIYAKTLKTEVIYRQQDRSLGRFIEAVHSLNAIKESEVFEIARSQETETTKRRFWFTGALLEKYPASYFPYLSHRILSSYATNVGVKGMTAGERMVNTPLSLSKIDPYTSKIFDPVSIIKKPRVRFEGGVSAYLISEEMAVDVPELSEREVYIDVERNMFVVNRKDYAFVAGTMGGGDQDDRTLDLSVNMKTGEVKVISNRTPNAIGEVVNMRMHPKSNLGGAKTTLTEEDFVRFPVTLSVEGVKTPSMPYSYKAAGVEYTYDENALLPIVKHKEPYREEDYNKVLAGAMVFAEEASGITGSYVNAMTFLWNLIGYTKQIPMPMESAIDATQKYGAVYPAQFHALIGNIAKFYNRISSMPGYTGLVPVSAIHRLNDASQALGLGAVNASVYTYETPLDYVYASAAIRHIQQEETALAIAASRFAPYNQLSWAKENWEKATKVAISLYEASGAIQYLLAKNYSHNDPYARSIADSLRILSFYQAVVNDTTRSFTGYRSAFSRFLSSASKRRMELATRVASALGAEYLSDLGIYGAAIEAVIYSASSDKNAEEFVNDLIEKNANKSPREVYQYIMENKPSWLSESFLLSNISEEAFNEKIDIAAASFVASNVSQRSKRADTGFSNSIGQLIIDRLTQLVNYSGDAEFVVNGIRYSVSDYQYDTTVNVETIKRNQEIVEKLKGQRLRFVRTPNGKLTAVVDVGSETYGVLTVPKELESAFANVKSFEVGEGFVGQFIGFTAANRPFSAPQYKIYAKNIEYFGVSDIEKRDPEFAQRIREAISKHGLEDRSEGEAAIIALMREIKGENVGEISNLKDVDYDDLVKAIGIERAVLLANIAPTEAIGRLRGATLVRKYFPAEISTFALQAKNLGEMLEMLRGANFNVNDVMKVRAATMFMFAHSEELIENKEAFFEQNIAAYLGDLTINGISVVEKLRGAAKFMLKYGEMLNDSDPAKAFENFLIQNPGGTPNRPTELLAGVFAITEDLYGYTWKESTLHETLRVTREFGPNVKIGAQAAEPAKTPIPERIKAPEPVKAPIPEQIKAPEPPKIQELEQPPAPPAMAARFVETPVEEMEIHPEEEEIEIHPEEEEVPQRPKINQKAAEQISEIYRRIHGVDIDKVLLNYLASEEDVEYHSESPEHEELMRKLRSQIIEGTATPSVLRSFLAYKDYEELPKRRIRFEKARWFSFDDRKQWSQRLLALSALEALNVGYATNIYSTISRGYHALRDSQKQQATYVYNLGRALYYAQTGDISVFGPDEQKAREALGKTIQELTASLKSKNKSPKLIEATTLGLLLRREPSFDIGEAENVYMGIAKRIAYGDVEDVITGLLRRSKPYQTKYDLRENAGFYKKIFERVWSFYPQSNEKGRISMKQEIGTALRAIMRGFSSPVVAESDGIVGIRYKFKEHYEDVRPGGYLADVMKAYEDIYGFVAGQDLEGLRTYLENIIPNVKGIKAAVLYGALGFLDANEDYLGLNEDFVQIAEEFGSDLSRRLAFTRTTKDGKKKKYDYREFAELLRTSISAIVYDSNVDARTAMTDVYARVMGLSPDRYGANIATRNFLTGLFTGNWLQGYLDIEDKKKRKSVAKALSRVLRDPNAILEKNDPTKLAKFFLKSTKPWARPFLAAYMMRLFEEKGNTETKDIVEALSKYAKAKGRDAAVIRAILDTPEISDINEAVSEVLSMRLPQTERNTLHALTDETALKRVEDLIRSGRVLESARLIGDLMIRGVDSEKIKEYLGKFRDLLKVWKPSAIPGVYVDTFAALVVKAKNYDEKIAEEIEKNIKESFGKKWGEFFEWYTEGLKASSEHVATMVLLNEMEVPYDVVDNQIVMSEEQKQSIEVTNLGGFHIKPADFSQENPKTSFTYGDITPTKELNFETAAFLSYVSKAYRQKEAHIEAQKYLQEQLESGENAVVLAPTGFGKTTLLAQPLLTRKGSVYGVYVSHQNILARQTAERITELSFRTILEEVGSRDPQAVVAKMMEKFRPVVYWQGHPGLRDEIVESDIAIAIANQDEEALSKYEKMLGIRAPRGTFAERGEMAIKIYRERKEEIERNKQTTKRYVGLLVGYGHTEKALSAGLVLDKEGKVVGFDPERYYEYIEQEVEKSPYYISGKFNWPTITRSLPFTLNKIPGFAVSVTDLRADVMMRDLVAGEFTARSPMLAVVASRGFVAIDEIAEAISHPQYRSLISILNATSRKHNVQVIATGGGIDETTYRFVSNAIGKPFGIYEEPGEHIRVDVGPRRLFTEYAENIVAEMVKSRNILPTLIVAPKLEDVHELTKQLREKYAGKLNVYAWAGQGNIEMKERESAEHILSSKDIPANTVVIGTSGVGVGINQPLFANVIAAGYGSFASSLQAAGRLRMDETSVELRKQKYGKGEGKAYILFDPIKSMREMWSRYEIYKNFEQVLPLVQSALEKAHKRMTDKGNVEALPIWGWRERRRFIVEELEETLMKNSYDPNAAEELLSLISGEEGPIKVEYQKPLWGDSEGGPTLKIATEELHKVGSGEMLVSDIVFSSRIPLKQIGKQYAEHYLKKYIESMSVMISEMAFGRSDVTRHAAYTPYIKPIQSGRSIKASAPDIYERLDIVTENGDTIPVDSFQHPRKVIAKDTDFAKKVANLMMRGIKPIGTHHTQPVEGASRDDRELPGITFVSTRRVKASAPEDIDELFKLIENYPKKIDKKYDKRIFQVFQRLSDQEREEALLRMSSSYAKAVWEKTGELEKVSSDQDALQKILVEISKSFADNLDYIQRSLEKFSKSVENASGQVVDFGKAIEQMGKVTGAEAINVFSSVQASSSPFYTRITESFDKKYGSSLKRPFGDDLGEERAAVKFGQGIIYAARLFNLIGGELVRASWGAPNNFAAVMTGVSTMAEATAVNQPARDRIANAMFPVGAAINKIGSRPFVIGTQMGIGLAAAGIEAGALASFAISNIDDAAKGASMLNFLKGASQAAIRIAPYIALAGAVYGLATEMINFGRSGSDIIGIPELVGYWLGAKETTRQKYIWPAIEHVRNLYLEKPSVETPAVVLNQYRVGALESGYSKGVTRLNAFEAYQVLYAYGQRYPWLAADETYAMGLQASASFVIRRGTERILEGISPLVGTEGPTRESVEQALSIGLSRLNQEDVARAISESVVTKKIKVPVVNPYYSYEMGYSPYESRGYGVAPVSGAIQYVEVTKEETVEGSFLDTIQKAYEKGALMGRLMDVGKLITDLPLYGIDQTQEYQKWIAFASQSRENLGAVQNMLTAREWRRTMSQQYGQELASQLEKMGIDTEREMRLTESIRNVFAQYGYDVSAEFAANLASRPSGAIVPSAMQMLQMGAPFGALNLQDVSGFATYLSSLNLPVYLQELGAQAYSGNLKSISQLQWYYPAQAQQLGLATAPTVYDMFGRGIHYTSFAAADALRMQAVSKLQTTMMPGGVSMYAMVAPTDRSLLETPFTSIFRNIPGYENAQGLSDIRNIYRERMAQYAQQLAGIQAAMAYENMRYLWGGSAGSWQNPAPGSAWYLEDVQRRLQHEYQMRSFALQRQRADIGYQFNIREMGIAGARMEASQAYQTYSLASQWRQMQLSWQYQDVTRALQWQWTQEDFQEQARFMTGRQRRLAERQMQRQTTMHNLEEEQIQKMRNLEKERYEKQKEYTEEMMRLEREQFELQKEQLDTYYKLQIEDIERSKQEYLEIKKVQDEMLEKQREHQARMLELQAAAASISAKMQEEQQQVEKGIQQAEQLFDLATSVVDEATKTELAKTVLKELSDTIKAASEANATNITSLNEALKSLLNTLNNVKIPNFVIRNYYIDIPSLRLFK